MQYPVSIDDLRGRLAIITGGGDGMGRSLAQLLTRAGCHIAICDLSAGGLAATEDLCRADMGAETRLSTHVADVSSESDLLRFRDEILAAHDTDHAHLVFLNAGIGGGGSMIDTDRDEWERTFDVNWRGVYLGTRVFLPLLVAADWGRLINTSSVNGFWASLGPDTPHTAYSAAKFAIKGFTEALITDLRMHAPHVECSVVMPGHIGTGIVANSSAVVGIEISDEVKLFDDYFRNNAPTSSDEAAQVIIDGVLTRTWRILVGDDAVLLDERVRATPTQAYERSFAGIGITPDER